MTKEVSPTVHFMNIPLEKIPKIHLTYIGSVEIFFMPENRVQRNQTPS